MSNEFQDRFRAQGMCGELVNGGRHVCILKPGHGDHDDMQEAPRPDPGFRIWVEYYGEQPAGLLVPDIKERIDVTHAVMDAYDVAVNSMDFGSGFLSTEEVEHLRELANAIGADPSPFRTSYK